MKLNYKRTFFVGLAFMSICAFWQVYDNVIPLILKDTFHVRDSYIGIVMAMDNRVFAEMKAVTWPTARQTRRDTFTVIMTSIIFAIYFAAVDWVINMIFQAFLY